MPDEIRPLRIMQILLSMGETSAPYNEHCLPWADKREITICSYLKPTIQHPKTITLFAGDGSFGHFFSGLRSALASKEYDAIHAHSPHVGLMLLGILFLGYWKYYSQTVFTVHDSYPNYKLRNRLLLLPVFALFRKIACCSNASYESFPAIYKWLAGNRLCAVQNGLDIERVDRVAAKVRAQSAAKENTATSAEGEAAFTLIAISRLVEIKNPFVVISAFAQSAQPQSHLVYIGHGVLREALDGKVQAAGMTAQVEFTGLIPRERVYEHLIGSDVFISTSRIEGLPVAAMACGVPVLLSDIAPHREIAKHGNFIPLLKTDDVAGFARELARFQSMSPSERRAVGKQCRQLVESHFSLRNMQAGYTKIYHEVSGQGAFSLAGAK